MIAKEVVACVAEGREPSVAELFRVAEIIGTEAAGERSIFRWADMAIDSAERLLCIQAAQAALSGS